jgi:hypothetical protein
MEAYLEQRECLTGARTGAQAEIEDLDEVVQSEQTA